MILITPFKTNKNENVLINRGWIKKELKDNPSININITKTNSFEGFLREIYKPNPFKPENNILIIMNGIL